MSCRDGELWPLELEVGPNSQIYPDHTVRHQRIGLRPKLPGGEVVPMLVTAIPQRSLPGKQRTRCLAVASTGYDDVNSSVVRARYDVLRTKQLESLRHLKTAEICNVLVNTGLGKHHTQSLRFLLNEHNDIHSVCRAWTFTKRWGSPLGLLLCPSGIWLTSVDSFRQVSSIALLCVMYILTLRYYWGCKKGRWSEDAAISKWRTMYRRKPPRRRDYEVYARLPTLSLQTGTVTVTERAVQA